MAEEDRILKLEKELEELKKSHEKLLQRFNNHINDVEYAHKI